jgi:c-di-GMP-binding flagellar brake protein YcgR
MDELQKFRPEPETTKLDRFRITGTSEIRTVLRRISDEGCPVGLFVDSPSFVTSRVLAVEQDHLDMEVDDGSSPYPRSWERVATADELVCVAFVDSVKVQFRTVGSLVESHGEKRLRLGLPQRVFRMQRREGYRVRPTREDPIWCVIPQMGARPYEVLDLSVVGIALRLPMAETPPLLGTELRDAKLRMPGPRVLPCGLTVRRVVTGTPEFGHRLGCSLEGLTPDASRALQRLVMDIERAHRMS